MTLYNSIVSGNTATNSSPDISGAYTDGVGNVIGSAGVNLSALGDYGGPTQTLLPLLGSAAICAGSTSLQGVTVPATDLPGATHSAAYCANGQMDAGAVQTATRWDQASRPSHRMWSRLALP